MSLSGIKKGGLVLDVEIVGSFGAHGPKEKILKGVTGKTCGKRTLARNWRRCEDNIEINFIGKVWLACRLDSSDSSKLACFL